MVFRRVGAHPTQSDAADLIMRFAQERGIHLQHLCADATFVPDLASFLDSARDPIRLHGRRVEEMFQYTVTGLGACRAIKREDAGELLLDETEPTVSTPDFRVLLQGGRELLVEVKNRNMSTKAITFRATYLQQLMNYGTSFGRPLYLAIYWSRWRQWTLHEAAYLLSLATTGNVLLSFPEAVAESEMQLLGDVSLGTLYPLELKLGVESQLQSRSGTVAQYSMITRTVELRCAGRKIEDKREQAIALGLMLHGRWSGTKPAVSMNEDHVESVTFSFAPEDPDPNNEFAIVGALSSLISSHFNDLTTDVDGIRRLHPEALPESPYPRQYDEYQSEALPLWRFVLQPNRAFRHRDRHA